MPRSGSETSVVMITEDAGGGPVRPPERPGGMVSDAVAGSCAGG